MCILYIRVIYIYMGIPAGRRTQKKKKPNPTTRKHDRIGCYFIIILIHYIILFLHTRLP